MVEKAATCCKTCEVVVHQQCFFFDRNIGWVAQNIIYFYYLKKIFSGSKYPKKRFNLILKTEALVISDAVFKAKLPVFGITLIL